MSEGFDRYDLMLMPANARGVGASVVVPVLNDVRFLAQQLDALANQTFDGLYEIIVADNGSTDGSIEVADQWSRRDARIRIVDASAKRGSSFARDTAVEISVSGLLLFCDADDIVSPFWVHAYVSRSTDFDAATGPCHAFTSSRPQPDSGWPTAGGRLIDPMTSLPGSNMAVHRSAFEAVGGFDEGLLRAQDLDFGIRLQLAGYEIAWVPDAKVHRRKPRTALGEFRKQRQYARPRAAIKAKYGDALPAHALRVRRGRLVLWLALRIPLALASSQHRRAFMGRLGTWIGYTEGRRAFRRTAAIDE